jgi:hypothetical protein
MGDGEDIGSDLDGDDEEEEEDEDGGFVVPDGYGSDDCEGEDAAKSKKRKLEQVLTSPQSFSPCSGTLGCLLAHACALALCVFLRAWARLVYASALSVGLRELIRASGLGQIVHYRSLPADLAEMLTVQVIDKLPLSLSSDPNIHLDENTDYYGLSNVVCALHSLCTREARVAHSDPFA